MSYRLQGTKSPEGLEHVLKSNDRSFRFECGFSRLITIENKQSVAWKHFVLYSLYAELTEFRNGSQVLLQSPHWGLSQSENSFCWVGMSSLCIIM